MYHISDRFIYLSFTGIVIVYIVGLLFPEIMEIDAAQYASMSLEMANTGNYLEVHNLGKNYLDKPPLLFWLSSIFMKIFGENQFVYRIPSFLSSILGIYAVFALGKRLYNRNTGILSALALATSQIYFLHNHDVRTDTLLSNFVVVAIWLGVAYIQDRKWIQLIGAFASIGMAMLAKGPIGAVVPVMAIGTHLLYQRDWKMIFNWRWIVGVIIVLIVLTPMMIGLYMQYDANPLAEVNDRTGVSGLRFFFWEQSFGRITGENVWKDDSSYFFFTHNYLWEFLPWSLIGLLGLWKKFKVLIQQRFRGNPEVELYTLGGFIFPFIALSTSQYKLPHYIMVVMPMIAILTGWVLDYLIQNARGKLFKVVSWIQFVFAFLIGFLGIFILYYVFPSEAALWYFIPIVIFIGAGILFFRSDPVSTLLGPSLVAVIAMNLLLNGYFYPQLNKFQGGANVAHYIMENEIPEDQFYVLGLNMTYNIYFYTHTYKGKYRDVSMLEKYVKDRDVYVYTNDKGLKKLKDGGITYQVLEDVPNFSITELTPEFLMKKTRDQTLEKNYIVFLEQQTISQ